MGGRGTRVSAYEVASVRKALEILCAFSAGSPKLSVSQISRRLKLPKSTAHNLLRTLQGFDFISQDEETKLFSLGPRVFELGLHVSQVVQIESVAIPHLHQLRELMKETIRLAVPSDDEALIIAAEESPFKLHTRGDVGRRTPLYSASLGKILLASMPSDQIREFVGRRGLQPFTRNTITSLARLEAEIGKIRTDGYALDWEESEEGVRCAAAAVRDATGRVVAAMSVSGPATRITEQRLRDLAVWIKQHSDEISSALMVRRITR